MGEKDVITKKYMSRPEVFADMFNSLVAKSISKIDPGDLREINPEELTAFYNRSSKRIVAVQRYRDLLKEAVIKTDDTLTYVLLGIENQSEIDYSMPARNMLYDSLHYDNEIKKKYQEHKLEEKEYKKRKKKFTSRLQKGDKLKPIITLVVYWGNDEWDGPTSLKEMLEEVPEEWQCYVQDYKIPVVAPIALTRENLDGFQTSLKEVMGFIKYSNDKDALRKFILDDVEFKHLETEAAIVLRTVADAKIEIDEEKEECNMCLALEQIREEGWQAGKAEGWQAGVEHERKQMAPALEQIREEGWQAGKAEGWQAGVEHERKQIASELEQIREEQKRIKIDIYRKLYQDGDIKLEKALTETGITEAEFLNF